MTEMRSVAFALFVCLPVAIIAAKDDSMIFSAVENGLPWPLPDQNDIEFPIAHGAHCVEAMAAFNTSDRSSINLRHRDHCIKYIEAVYKFLQANKNFMVDPIICENVQTIIDTSMLMFSFLLTEPAFRGELDKPKVFESQNARFFYQMMTNYRKLIWKPPMGLAYTPQESAYVEKMIDSEFATRNSAMSIFCASGANWKLVTSKLEAIFLLAREK